MKRTAIIILKDMNRGSAANAAAILMGQVVKLHPELYDTAPVVDADGQAHASIRYSVIILEATSSEQLTNYLNKLRGEYQDLTTCTFAAEGQSLNNAFDEYKKIVTSRTTESLKPVGAIVCGEDDRVRSATKKFSVAK